MKGLAHNIPKQLIYKKKAFGTCLSKPPPSSACRIRHFIASTLFRGNMSNKPFTFFYVSLLEIPTPPPKNLAQIKTKLESSKLSLTIFSHCPWSLFFVLNTEFSPYNCITPSVLCDKPVEIAVFLWIERRARTNLRVPSMHFSFLLNDRGHPTFPSGSLMPL